MCSISGVNHYFLAPDSREHMLLELESKVLSVKKVNLHGWELLRLLQNSIADVVLIRYALSGYAFGDCP
jgi:hypothetical protein